VTPLSSLAAVPVAQQAGFEKKMHDDFESLVGNVGQPWLRATERDNGTPVLRLDDAAFRGDSGELSAAALMPLSNLIQASVQAGPCVIHVIGERIGDSAPVADVGERRAAAVAAVLADLGAPSTRVRYESRLIAGRAAGVDIVVQTIVEGSESKAYMPPTMTGASG
jgi:hypothetical protein